MSLEKGKISSSQLVYLVVSDVLGIGLVIPPGAPVKQDAWIAIILGLIVGLLISLIYLGLIDRFPGKTFIEISDIVYGPFLGKLISFFFILFLFHICSLLVIDFSNLFKYLFMPNTPFIVFMVLITLMVASAVRNGIEVIARCSQVLIPIIILNIIFTEILLLKDINIENFLPVFETPINKMIWIIYRVGIISFSTMLFIMIAPFVNKQGEVKKSVINGTVIGAIILIFIAIRNIGVLGGSGGIYTYPSFQVVRLINYGQILTRLDILVVLNFFAGGFLQYSLTFYYLSLGMAQLLNLRTYLPLVLPLGVFITFQIHYYNIVETIEYQDVYIPIITIYHVIIPLTTFITAIIRKLPREER